RLRNPGWLGLAVYRRRGWCWQHRAGARWLPILAHRKTGIISPVQRRCTVGNNELKDSGVDRLVDRYRFEMGIGDSADFDSLVPWIASGHHGVARKEDAGEVLLKSIHGVLDA